MALVIADRVLETTTTTGSGTITLAGAEPGYQSFAVVGNGNETYYTIAGDTEWEVGIGTYTSSGTTLSRDTVLSSSDSGNKVTFSAGVKKVFVTYPSEKSVNFDVSGNISVSSAIITNVAEPVVGSDAATKLYVDSLVAAGVTYHVPVKYEVPNTTGNLVATYNNGTAGVSATLTNAGSLVPFVPDGVTASTNDRILVYSQTNAYENGVYVVSTVGDGSTAWVLTRATDADTYGLKSPNSLGNGDAFFVTSGNAGAGETYICNTSGVISFGSTAISFAQISSAQVYKAGNGISLTNTTISLVTPVAVANGGTGQSTTPSNGQLLIGNGTSFVLSTLTAGSGVSITNSAGSITLSATNSGAVTSVTASGPLASSGGATPDISIANSTGTGGVVLDQGATISSATITAAASASITTITGTSANITTVSGTTTAFSSGTISQLGATSATIATLSGTTATYSSGTVTQFGATSATIATVSGTNLTYTNGNLTSATVTTASGTNLSYGSATITTGNLTFSGTAQRITGDTSNATVADRLFFQNSVTNGPTSVAAIPNGTGAYANFVANAQSDPANSSRGQLAAIAGSEVSLRSDITGTGTYLPMAFYTGGSERARIDTSGNVGIGKTPTQKLDVSGTISGTTVSATTGTFTSANITTLTGTTLTLSSKATAATFTATQANAFYGLIIDRTGASPSTGSIYNGGNLLNFTYNGTAITFSTGGTPTEKVRITSAGNVGIGTTSPQGQLHSTASSDYEPAGYFESNSSAVNWARTDWKNQNIATTGIIYMDQGGEFAIRNDGAYPLSFYTNGGNQRMTITSAGNVGIGTSSPDSKLSVYTATGTTQFRFGASSSYYWDISRDNDTTGDLWISNYNATGSRTTRMVVSASGNVGIGTASPSSKLQVSGTITGTSGSFTSANITTLTGTTFGTTTGTTVNASTVNVTTTGTTINSNGDIYAIRSGGGTGVIYFGNSGSRYLYYNGANYFMPNGQLYVNGVQAVTNSGTWAISITGSAAGSVPSRGTSNWNDGTVINNVVGMLAWKNYGNNHVIFDASQGIAPNGTAVNNTNPAGNWTASYPTLMGWNGSNTYGVRVDSCRVADSVTGNAATATNASYAYNYTQSFASNWNTDFSNTPAGSTKLAGDTSTGSSANGPGGTWWFQQNMRHTNGSNYWGVQVAWGWEDNANILRTRNVTGGSYGSWITYLNSNNYNSYAPTLTGTGASGNWNISAAALYTTTPALGFSVSGQSISYGTIGGPQVQSQGGGAAMMSFHRPGAYGVNFGLDSDNQLKVGGWSLGAVSYVIITSNNIASYIPSTSPIASIQRGTGSTPFPYATANITISAVNTAKASVRYLGTAPNGTSSPYWSSQGYFALTSSTNLMFVPRPSQGPGQVYSWEVVEYV